MQIWAYAYWQQVYLSSITVAIVFLNGPIFVMISESWSENSFRYFIWTRKQKSQEKSVCFGRS